jgi:hypothetical protein
MCERRLEQKSTVSPSVTACITYWEGQRRSNENAAQTCTTCRETAHVSHGERLLTAAQNTSYNLLWLLASLHWETPMGCPPRLVAFSTCTQDLLHKAILDTQIQVLQSHTHRACVQCQLATDETVGLLPNCSHTGLTFGAQSSLLWIPLYLQHTVQTVFYILSLKIF